MLCDSSSMDILCVRVPPPSTYQKHEQPCAPTQPGVRASGRVVRLFASTCGTPSKTAMRLKGPPSARTQKQNKVKSTRLKKHDDRATRQVAHFNSAHHGEEEGEEGGGGVVSECSENRGECSERESISPCSTEREAVLMTYSPSRLTCRTIEDSQPIRSRFAAD